MNVVLWIVAGVLASLFLGAGLTKLGRPKEKLAATMAWVEDFTPGMVKLIGSLEVAAAVGLILPAVTGIAPVIVPLAAVGLVALMIGAAVTHARRKETPMIGVNAVLAVLAAFVAVGRFALVPFTS